MSLSLRPSLACTPPASVSVGSMLLTHDPGYIGVFSTPENAAAAPIAMTAPVMIGQPQGQQHFQVPGQAQQQAQTQQVQQQQLQQTGS